MAQLSLSLWTFSRSTLIGPSCGSTAPSATPVTSNLPERDTREAELHFHPGKRTDLHFRAHLLKFYEWMNYILILQWTCKTDGGDIGERENLSELDTQPERWTTQVHCQLSPVNAWYEKETEWKCTKVRHQCEQQWIMPKYNALQDTDISSPMTCEFGKHQ
jgi:hypothetical protein